MTQGPQRLHALDAVWREMEGSGPSIAIGTVALAEGPAPDQAAVRGLLAERLPRMPRMAQALSTPTIGLRRPAWVDVELDLDQHVHRLVVDPSGTQAPIRPASLDAAVSAIMEHRLPEGRPLWDAWVVDSLPGRRWALVWRVHHTVADGLGALALLGHGFDTAPEGGPSLADAVLAGQAQPRGWGQASAGGGGWGGVLRSAASGVGDAVGAVRSLLPHVAPSAVSALPQLPSSLTGAVGDRRRWVSVDVPLPEVKAARRAFGVTLNDVVLACVAGGFRVLLEHRGEAVAGRSVRNLVPVALAPAADGHAGNRVSALLGHLPAGEADPIARLHAVATAVGHGKHAQQAATLSMLIGLADRAVPAAVQDFTVSTVGRFAPALFIDTLTTNVPGPPFPVYLLGRRVAAMYPMIPVAGHTPITTGIFSYDGMLDVGVTGDGELAG
ncbi:MAG TPA: wax ester/triacylglycerol synthase family O-acyltransferase, partial [Candidatus Nanopelagicales bacterium]